MAGGSTAPFSGEWDDISGKPNLVYSSDITNETLIGDWESGQGDWNKVSTDLKNRRENDSGGSSGTYSWLLEADSTTSVVETTRDLSGIQTLSFHIVEAYNFGGVVRVKIDGNTEFSTSTESAGKVEVDVSGYSGSSTIRFENDGSGGSYKFYFDEVRLVGEGSISVSTTEGAGGS